MKRFAIISDIHANIDALNAVLEDIRNQQIDEIICLGDIVGYNAAPVECIRAIRDIGCKVVKGNHDHYCSDLTVSLDDFHANAASVIDWTRRMLSDADMDWLKNLPYVMTYQGFMGVHATLDTPENFRYIFDEWEAADNFACQRTSLCFFGHTHEPCIFYRSPDHSITRFSPVDGKLDKGSYFINVGSVGQPRDKDPRASYLILTVKSMTERYIEFRRVDYDIEAAVDRIRAANLPARLATRLMSGI